MEQRINVAKMRMLRQVNVYGGRNGITKEDKIRNDYIRSILGVASIVDKKEKKLRCFGHVKRYESDTI